MAKRKSIADNANMEFITDSGWDKGTQRREHLRGKVINAFRKGVVASDKRGHFQQIGFKIQPIFIDLLHKVAGIMPDAFWYRKGRKSQSAIYRTIFVIGIETALNYVEEEGLLDDPALKEIHDQLETAETLSAIVNIAEQRQEVEALQKRLLSSANINEISQHGPRLARSIKTLNEIEDGLVEMLGTKGNARK